jgi:tyrosine decarboxylase / aspartate 1-decarboxylase
MLDKESLKFLKQALEKLDAGFASLPAIPAQSPQLGRIEEVLASTAERLRDNYPYFHPMYAGQMLKPPHPVARSAYALAQWINPNNHALDGGRASSAMEKEAVAEIARMFGWTGTPRPFDERRYHGQPGSALDCRPTRSWKNHHCQRTGALHA